MSSERRPRRSPRVGLTLTLAIGLVAWWGCASLRAPFQASSPGAGRAAAAGATTPGGEQALYRLTYDSGEGRTGLKVVLRRSVGDRFQVVFSDVVGRRVWSLDHSPERAILVDHRAGTHCTSGSELSLPEVHPRELPLAAIPRVLAGRLPVQPPVAAGGSRSEEGEGNEEFVDDAGRRWRLSRRGDELVAWSLLDTSGPALWWARDREGGILSRRGGEQYRWSLVVLEPSSTPLGDIVPVGSVEGVCDD